MYSCETSKETLLCALIEISLRHFESN